MYEIAFIALEQFQSKVIWANEKRNLTFLLYKAFRALNIILSFFEFLFNKSRRFCLFVALQEDNLDSNILIEGIVIQLVNLEAYLKIDSSLLIVREKLELLFSGPKTYGILSEVEGRVRSVVNYCVGLRVEALERVFKEKDLRQVDEERLGARVLSVDVVCV